MIYYIYHSAFAVELEKNILIFDYYKIPKGKSEKEREFLEKYIEKTDKQVYVFSSHSHSDHFNHEILNWKNMNRNIIYVFSDDIKITKSMENVHFTHEDDRLELFSEINNDKITIFTFGSTDLGSSFYVNIEGKNIFHAGDLHFWHWEDDTDLEEKEMKKAYITQLQKIQKLSRINLAFTPVDPRLGKNVYEGVEIFQEMLKPEVIIPMHFADDYSAMNNKLIEKFKNKEVKIIEIKDSMSNL